MSLRAEIADALDEVITPAPMLERTVTAYVLADHRDRKVLSIRPRRAPWSFRSGATLAAALLVVALIAGLILGGRILRDFQSTPVPAIPLGELHKLEARPLLAMPAMSADGACPSGPVAKDFLGNPAVGNGAVRTIQGGGGGRYTGAREVWEATGFVVGPLDKRFFLVRARDVQTGAAVYFAGNISGVNDAQFGHAYLTGPVAGHDEVNGQNVPLLPEMVIDASKSSDKANGPNEDAWAAYIGFPIQGSHCVFFQVDYDDSPPQTFVRGY